MFSHASAQALFNLKRTKETYGCSHETDPYRVEEEPDLPGGRGRLALAARRSLHRAHRSLQPADRSVDDRARRGEGEGLAFQGRPAERSGREADQGRRHRRLEAPWQSFSPGSPAISSTTRARSASRRSSRTASPSFACMSHPTTSAR